MQKVQNSWLRAITTFFDNHPEREFYVGEATIPDVKGATQAFWLVGFASQPMDVPGFRSPDFRSDRKTVPVIVRRPDPVEGRPVPGVIVLDGGMTLPVFTEPAQPRKLEQFGAFIWQAAMETARAGKSLKAALEGTGLIRRT